MKNNDNKQKAYLNRVRRLEWGMLISWSNSRSQQEEAMLFFFGKNSANKKP